MWALISASCSRQQAQLFFMKAWTDWAWYIRSRVSRMGAPLAAEAENVEPPPRRVRAMQAFH